eukprot:maker-scaffold397_size184017-snap-gene-0.43 protein:Tk01049 transcript:maker-scaffold397_size184017-snap-gene-0.43-mRNA-1 annotation:"multidrug abc transporter atp-binding protein"
MSGGRLMRFRTRGWPASTRILMIRTNAWQTLFILKPISTPPMGLFPKVYILSCLSVALAAVTTSALPQGNPQERSVVKRSVGDFQDEDEASLVKRQSGYNAWRKGKRDSLYEPFQSDLLDSSIEIGGSPSEHLRNFLTLYDTPGEESPFAGGSTAAKRTPYSQWRKNGKRTYGNKRDYRDWRKGKRSETDLDEIQRRMNNFLTNPQRRSEMGFKQWRKMG